MTNKAPVFSKDIPNKQLTVVRDFEAPVDLVWKAWTESEILDQWWAPKPWKAETKVMDFKVGGRWLYCMVSPNAEQHWCRVDFRAINRRSALQAPPPFVMKKVTPIPLCQRCTGCNNSAQPLMARQSQSSLTLTTMLQWKRSLPWASSKALQWV
jgi:hypothetical protein